MTECEVCGKDMFMPFQCNYCKKYFCEEHRLPENHHCEGAPARTPLGSIQSKQRASTEKKTKTGMVSEGDFHFRKETGRAMRNRRHLRVRPWYLFLIFLFVVWVVLVGLSQYYTSVLGDFALGWTLGIYSLLVIGVLIAIGLLYLERWWRRHMRRFWGE
jgi:polyferredoxin